MDFAEYLQKPACKSKAQLTELCFIRSGDVCLYQAYEDQIETPFLLVAGDWKVPVSKAKIEEGKGSYVLLIRVASAIDIDLRGHVHSLAEGFYAYCGSARGPGGLSARIGRHRRRDKPVHWHVDQVTTKATVLRAGVSFDRNECDLVRLLLSQSGVSVPVPGFGSSDCRICESHFLMLADEDAFGSLQLEPFAG